MYLLLEMLKAQKVTDNNQKCGCLSEPGIITFARPIHPFPQAQLNGK
jgi:hypothetical protein